MILTILRGPEGLPGLSAINGQSQSVYVDGFVTHGDEPFAHIVRHSIPMLVIVRLTSHNPGGSSTGSAVAVAAGYCPISIGGEANGSIQTPASRSNLYSLKITPQTLSTEGIFHIVPTVETLGGMAKTVADLEEVTRVILQTANTVTELHVDRSREWISFSFGFVDPEKWRLPPELFITTDEYRYQIVSFPPTPEFGY